MSQFSSICSLCFHEPEVATRDIQPTVHANTEAVGCVICRAFVVTKCQISDQNFLFFRNTIAVCINECRKMRWVYEVKPVVIPNQTTGGIDLAEDLGLIGSTIAIIGTLLYSLAKSKFG